MHVRYSDYRQFATLYVKYLDCLKSNIEVYSTVLSAVESKGIENGAIHDSLINYRTRVKKLVDLIDNLRNKSFKSIGHFLNALDDAQKIDGESILYDLGYGGIRNYTDEYFEGLNKLCDDLITFMITPNSFNTPFSVDRFDGTFDNLEDIIAKVYLLLGKSFDFLDIKKIQKYTMEANDITKNELKIIRTSVHSVEGKYTGVAIELCGIASTIEEYIGILNQVICMPIGDFQKVKFSVKFKERFLEIERRLDKIDFEDGDIYEYIKETVKSIEFSDFVEYMLATDSVIVDYIYELKKLDLKSINFWRNYIFTIFDKAADEIRATVDPNYNYSYDEYNNDIWLAEMIDRVADVEDPLESNEDAIKIVRDLIKGNCEDGEEFLYYVTPFMDEIVKNFKDYQKCLQVLDSMERNYAFSPELQNSIERIRSEYERSLLSMVTNIKEKYWEQGIEITIENLEQVFDCSVVGVVKGIHKGIDIIGDLTGMSEEAKAEMYLIDNNRWEIEIDIGKTCLDNAYENLKNCDADSPKYQTCLDDFKNCFELYKKTHENIYRKMAICSTDYESTDGVVAGFKNDKSSYYTYCAEKYSRLTIQNYEDFELLTYEEYMDL